MNFPFNTDYFQCDIWKEQVFSFYFYLYRGGRKAQKGKRENIDYKIHISSNRGLFSKRGLFTKRGLFSKRELFSKRGLFSKRELFSKKELFSKRGLIHRSKSLP